MNKVLINNRFKEAINLLIERNFAKNKREIAEKLEIIPTKLSEILAHRMSVSAELIAKMAKLYPQIPLEFYFSENDQFSIDNNNIQSPVVVQPTASSLPLIPISAVAGWNGIDSSGILTCECEHINMPYLSNVGAEFLIRVTGNSMQPNYNNGDIIACRKMRDTGFFQWGKTYLIDSEQGAMIKRIFPTDNDEYIECRSDNPLYPPFMLLKNEIRSLSTIVATVRIE